MPYEAQQNNIQVEDTAYADLLEQIIKNIEGGGDELLDSLTKMDILLCNEESLHAPFKEQYSELMTACVKIIDSQLNSPLKNEQCEEKALNVIINSIYYLSAEETPEVQAHFKLLDKAIQYLWRENIRLRVCGLYLLQNLSTECSIIQEQLIQQYDIVKVLDTLCRTYARNDDTTLLVLDIISIEFKLIANNSNTLQYAQYLFRFSDLLHYLYDEEKNHTDRRFDGECSQEIICLVFRNLSKMFSNPDIENKDVDMQEFVDNHYDLLQELMAVFLRNKDYDKRENGLILGLIANLLTAENQIPQVLYRMGLFEVLARFACHEDENLRGKAIRGVSNLLFSDLEEVSIQQILRYGQVWLVMAKSAYEEKKQSLRDVALCCLCQALSLGEKEFFQTFLDMHDLDTTLELLFERAKQKCTVSLLLKILEALKSLLIFGAHVQIQRGAQKSINSQNFVRQQIIKRNYARLFEDLQHHKNEEVYVQAQSIVREFFNCEEYVIE